MNKVTTINLNGRAYQLEEAGYTLLQDYLEKSLMKLHDNPDKEEIKRDLEQAIAEKCDKVLSRHKSVVTEADIQKIIKEMGPVEDESPETSSTAPKGDTPKKLYRIKEGAIISGVCQGLAVYFNLDVTLVRIGFILLGFITHGAMLLIYALMVFIIPKAKTGEEHARAYGEEWSAQRIVDEIRNNIETHSKEDWRRWKREWKKQWREEAREARQNIRHHAGFIEGLWSVFGLFVWILIISFGLWFGYHHYAVIHDFLDAVKGAYDHLIENLATL